MLTKRRSFSRVYVFVVLSVPRLLSDENVYKIDIIKELTDVKFGESFVEGFSRKELDTILNDVCTLYSVM